MMSEIVFDKTQIQDISKWVLENITSRVVCFYGDLGSGKTTLIKQLIRIMGSTDVVTSPTFGIINEYSVSKTKDFIIHIDCYRLTSIEEAIDVGIIEYLDSENGWIFLEWAEILESFLPYSRSEITLSALGPDTRKLKLKNYINK